MKSAQMRQDEVFQICQCALVSRYINPRSTKPFFGTYIVYRGGGGLECELEDETPDTRNCTMV